MNQQNQTIKNYFQQVEKKASVETSYGLPYQNNNEEIREDDDYEFENFS